MRIDAKLFGHAATLIAAVAYFIGGFFAAIGRGATQGFFSYILHLDLIQIVRPISVISFAFGLLLFSALVGTCAWLTARVYNALAVRTATASLPRPAAVTR
jgi:hypothetical protein